MSLGTRQGQGASGDWSSSDRPPARGFAPTLLSHLKPRNVGLVSTKNHVLLRSSVPGKLVHVGPYEEKAKSHSRARIGGLMNRFRRFDSAFDGCCPSYTDQSMRAILWITQAKKRMDRHAEVLFLFVAPLGHQVAAAFVLRQTVRESAAAGLSRAASSLPASKVDDSLHYTLRPRFVVRSEPQD